MKPAIFALVALAILSVPLVAGLTDVAYTAGYREASRFAVRSFDGWDCSARTLEYRRYQFAVPLWMETEVCNQWTRPPAPRW